MNALGRPTPHVVMTLALTLLLVGSGPARAGQPIDGRGRGSAPPPPWQPPAEVVATLQRLSTANAGVSEETARALAVLEARSPSFFWSGSRGRVTYLFGTPLDGVMLDHPGDRRAARRAVRRLLRRHAGLFGMEREQLRRTRLSAITRGSTSLLLRWQQRHEGLRVLDGRFATVFDGHGRLTRFVGLPRGRALLEHETRPSLSADVAARLALDAVRERYEHDAPLDLSVSARPELVLHSRRGLLWEIVITGAPAGGLQVTARVDALDGAIDDIHFDSAEGVRPIPLRHYRHPGGTRGDLTLGIRNINVNTVEINFGFPWCFYSLQRLGSGRARMWSARGYGCDESCGGNDACCTVNPSFTRSWFVFPCFVPPPFFLQSPLGIGDPAWRFNEQQAYWWAQLLKTRIDLWGRQPNAYGHYPPEGGRAVNVEIVVNGQGYNEDSWCGFGVMHGCFVSSVSGSRFAGLSSSQSYPGVLLFNHSLNVNSPQHIGPEISPSYSIVDHEVGHFISWTYGSWDGVLSGIRRSFNEGFSMVLPGLFAKDRWPALDYTDSFEVTTGGGGGVQWTHHALGSPPLRLDDRMCTDNVYRLGWPFVQAMWHLTNNLSENGDVIWEDDQAAVSNTADLFMWALYNDTDNPDLTWPTLVFDLTLRASEQAGLAQAAALPANQSIWRVLEVFLDHGLYADCELPAIP